MLFHPRFLGLWIQILGLHGVFWYFFQRINITVVYAAVESLIERLYYHDFCTFAVMHRKSSGVQHPVVAALELDTMAAVNGSFVQNGEDQIDCFFFWLRFKHRFDTIKRQSEFCIEFFYVGV